MGIAGSLTDDLPDFLDQGPDGQELAATYFSFVTLSTLGYGDIVLGPDLRIFAAFAAVTGLLAFGLSTAYLVAMMTRMFEHHGKI